MIRGLLEKELRQHGYLLGFLALLLLGGLALISGHGRLERITGGGFMAVLIMYYTFVPLVCLALGPALIATEFRQKTQLFLEGLPLPRWRTLLVKFILGLVVLLAAVGLALGYVAWRSRFSEAMTPRFATLLILKSAGWVWLLYTLCFAHAFLGRYRIIFGVAIFFGIFQLTQSGLDLTGLGPFALMDVRFPYERVLLLSVAMVIFLTRGWFALVAGLLFWFYLWFRQAGADWLAYIDPHGMLAPDLVEGDVVIPWPRIGAHRGVSAVCLFLAWLAFRHMGDRAQRLSQQVHRNILVRIHGADAPARLLRAMGRPGAPAKLAGTAFWRDAMQHAGLDFERLSAAYEQSCTDIANEEQEFTARLPKLTAEVKFQDEEIMLRPTFTGDAPGRVVCLVEDDAPFGVGVQSLPPGKDGTFTLSRSRHLKSTLRYLLGWRTPSTELPVFEAWQEAAL